MQKAHIRVSDRISSTLHKIAVGRCLSNAAQLCSLALFKRNIISASLRRYDEPACSTSAYGIIYDDIKSKAVSLNNNKKVLSLTMDTMLTLKSKPIHLSIYQKHICFIMCILDRIHVVGTSMYTDTEARPS